MAKLLAETARMAAGARQTSPIWGRAAALIAAVGLIASLGGVAAAADYAVPGDLLYAVDIAFERVGLGDGGFEERITELDTPVARGDLDAAHPFLQEVKDDALAQGALHVVERLENRTDEGAYPEDLESRDSGPNPDERSTSVSPPHRVAPGGTPAKDVAPITPDDPGRAGDAKNDAPSSSADPRGSSPEKSPAPEQTGNGGASSHGNGGKGNEHPGETPKQGSARGEGQGQPPDKDEKSPSAPRSGEAPSPSEGSQHPGGHEDRP